MLSHRIIGLALWIIVLWIVIFLVPGWVFAISISVLVGFGLYEFFDMVSKKGILVYRYFGIITGCFIPLSAYMRFAPSAEMEFIFIMTICLCVFLLQFTRRNTEQALVGIATTVFGILYIGWFVSFMVKLRVLPPLSMDGRFLILYLIATTKSGDIGSYIVGTFFGKHQLIPRISPKKSVEGTIAGSVISFLVAVSLRNLLPAVSFVNICVIGLLLSVVGQIGDLSESLLKRDCKVKDSGFIFPGLGGILDMIDSLIFATPIFYFYLRLM
jgi:phosphatidate cytidylyltransferase